MLNIGDKAPDFAISATGEQKLNLSDLKGKFVILYFYPKDDTPGCTIEAKEFNSLKTEFDKLNSVILGVSKDDLTSHSKFKEKYCLEFDLISDNSGICELYGVWGEKSMYGKKYMGINRSSFLINPAGKIAYIWAKVSVNEHAKEVLEKIQSMNNEQE